MNTITQNNTTYTTTEILIKGKVFAVTVVIGKFNYVNVIKVSNNPFASTGKDFANFDEAARSYKSLEMKTALLKLADPQNCKFLNQIKPNTMKIKFYKIQDTQAGNIIETNLNEYSANAMVQRFEQEDKSNDIYVPDFYQIKEMED